MRITRIKLQNYRQYRDVEVDFSNSSKDLHLLIGDNAQGKSNLLNAINWCLYSSEPHLTNQTRALPVVNLDLLKEESYNENQLVKVEVEVEDDDTIIKFERQANYLMSQIKQVRKPAFERLVVSKQKKGGNWQIYRDEDAISEVEYYFPQDFREIFFFDGEHLSSYFREVSGKKIKNTIKVVSQIQVLEVIEDRLGKVLTKKRREATKANPKTQLVEKEITQYNKEIERFRSQISELTDTLASARNEIKELEEYLGSAPDIEEINTQRKTLLDELKYYEKLRKDKESEFYRIAPGLIVLLFLKEDMKDFQNKIDELQQAKQIPPTIERRLVEKIIEDKKCAICESELREKNLETVKNLLESIKISSDLARVLNEQDKMLFSNISQIKAKRKTLESIVKDISSFKKMENTKRGLFEKVDRDFSMIPNPGEIEKAWNKRRDLSAAIGRTNRDIGSLQAQLKIAIENKNNKEEELSRQIKKLGLAKALQNEIDFCEKALNAVNIAKLELIEDTRENVRKSTKEKFFELNFVSDNYTDVLLNENYELDVIHRYGIGAAGGLSGAERLLLALAYILALHEITNLDSPLIIDTPIATVAGENRLNFAKVLAKISESKQIVLLLTPAEYSEELINSFHGSFATRRRIICKGSTSSVEEYR